MDSRAKIIGWWAIIIVTGLFFSAVIAGVRVDSNPIPQPVVSGGR